MCRHDTLISETEHDRCHATPTRTSGARPRAVIAGKNGRKSGTWCRNHVPVAGPLMHQTANYRRVGSPTTPPCTEGVHWIVLEDTVTVSDEDMAQFARRISFNARLVQRRSK